MSIFFSGSLRMLVQRWILPCIIAGLSCACSRVVPLQSALSDPDANEIVLVLNHQGIYVEKGKEKEGVTLTVKEADLSRATEAMNGAGLPRRSLSNLGEVFKKQGMISTPMEERIRYIHGLSEELESTLQQFDNVISARVHVVLPERIAPGEPIQPSSAAVFIKYRPPMDEDVVAPRIRRLVASSIPGLSGEDGRNKVSVVMTPGEPQRDGIEWTDVGPFKVDVKSAGRLLFTFIALTVIAISSLASLAWVMLKQHPVVVKLRVRLSRAEEKKSVDEDKNAVKRSADNQKILLKPDKAPALKKL